MIEFLIIAGCFFVQLLFVLVDVPSVSYLGQLLIVFGFNVLAAWLIHSELPSPPEPIRPDTAKLRPTSSQGKPGSGSTSNSSQQQTSPNGLVPVDPPPPAAQSLWDRWCRALATSNPDTLGSQYLERVNALVNKGEPATDEENQRSELRWFEEVYNDLWQKVRSEGKPSGPMSIFAEIGSELGYSVITTESGAAFDDKRHETVGNSGRTSVIDQMLLPGLRLNEYASGWLAIVTLRL
jgi:hypothetical protein